MKEIIKQMNSFVSVLNEKDTIAKLIVYYNSKFYVVVLLKQEDRLKSNLESINALLTLGNVEDAYTIFRKYLETYFVIMSVLENITIVEKYMLHDLYLGYKACGEKKEEIKKFKCGKPDGYLEYGYLEGVVETKGPDFKYTMKSVCIAAKMRDYYQWYNICSNFVHNNLSSVKIDQKEGKEKLIDKCRTLTEHMTDRFRVLVNI